MSGDAFEEYLAKWRAAQPQRQVAWLFLRQDERVRYGALAAMEREWLKAMHEVREPQVATIKLRWWREEMQRVAEGDARHPLTQALFADARARAVSPACWTAPVDAAIMALAPPPPADFAAQRQAAEPFARAIAELETRLWFGAVAKSLRAAQVTLVAHLASNTRALAAEIGYGRSPLPMNLLARHALTIDGLGRDGPARRAALRDQAGQLRRELAAAAKMSGPLTLFRAVGLQHDIATLARAARADEPLAALQAPVHGLGSALKIWHAARTWRSEARAQRT